MYTRIFIYIYTHSLIVHLTCILDGTLHLSTLPVIRFHRRGPRASLLLPNNLPTCIFPKVPGRKIYTKCIYMCIYIYIYVYTCVCIIYIYIYIVYTCVYLYLYIYLYIYIYITIYVKTH